MMPRVVKLHIAFVACLTGVQWLMFSANALWGVVGLVLLGVWGLLGDASNAPRRAGLHAGITAGIAALTSYLPMIATLCGRSWWPG
jgi:hypothetical protein